MDRREGGRDSACVPQEKLRVRMGYRDGPIDACRLKQINAQERYCLKNQQCPVLRSSNLSRIIAFLQNWTTEIEPGKETGMNEVNSQDRPWSYESVQELISLVREGVPDTVIAMKMKRSLTDIHSKLSELGLSAKTGE